jgi:septum formation protein
MDIDETPHSGELARDYVGRMAKEKALTALPTFPDAVVLASDTSVILDGEILGKPKSEAHAVSMLTRLSGNQHQVLTSIALAKYEQEAISIEVEVVETQVEFDVLSDQQIRDYVATGEPMDKAGAYGIQGKGALLIKGIQGSYSNVVGLPLTETGKMLQRFNVPVWQD